jgi:hypothetical protein
LAHFPREEYLMASKKEARANNAMRQGSRRRRDRRRPPDNDWAFLLLLVVGGAGLLEVPFLFMVGAEAVVDSVVTIATTALASAAGSYVYRR